MVIQEGYKQTEIGVIPRDWEVKKLNDIVESGKIPSGIYKDKRLYGNGCKIIKLGDVFRFDYFKPELAQKVQLSFKEIEAYKVQIDDIIIALASVKLEGVGKVMLIDDLDEETVYDHNVALIRLKNNYSSKYIVDLFKSTIVRKYIASKATQVGTTFLKSSTLLNLEVPLPPTLAEQTAIATALSDVDGLITGLEKLIAKKRNIKQGAMQQLLQPKEGWEVKKLGEYLKVKHGRSQKEVEDKNGKYPILGTGGLMSYTNSFLYDKPSVLIGRKGTIDKPQFMNSPFWTVDTLFYTEINQNISPKFIYYRFLLIDWYSHNEASGVPSLNAKTIENIEISVPDFEEQTRIATILSDMDAELSALEQKLEKYKKIKLGMMQELLTGKTRLV